MRIAAVEPGGAALARIEVVPGEEPVEPGPEAAAPEGGAASPVIARRRLRRPTGEPGHFRQSRLGGDARGGRGRAGIEPLGKEGDVRDVRADGAGPARRQAGPEASRI